MSLKLVSLELVYILPLYIIYGLIMLRNSIVKVGPMTNVCKYNGVLFVRVIYKKREDIL